MDQRTDIDIDSIQSPTLSYVPTVGYTDSKIQLIEESNYHSSPLLRLPPDITSEIFKAYIFAKDVEAKYRNPASLPRLCFSHSARLLFGSICRAWRALAWSSPWVWSSVSLVLDHPVTNSAGLLNEWLSRSGQSKLTIALECEALHEETRDIVLDVMSVVSRFSERWSHIVLDLPAPCYAALSCVKGCVPLLAFVSMRLRGSSDGLPDLLEIFSVAPKLRAAHVDVFPVHRMVLPIPQFDLLIGYRSDVAGTLGVLRTSPQLVCAMFNILEDSDAQTSDSNIDTKPMLLLNLQSLHLSSIPTSSDMNTLLDNLTSPNLHTLHLITNDTANGHVFGHSNFISFISRSACLLRSLSIDATSMQLSDNDLLHCLEVMPSLVALDIRFQGISSETIRNLKVTPDRDPVLPNLQRLSIVSETLELDFLELYDTLFTRREVAYGSGGSGGSGDVAKLESLTILTLDANWESHALGMRSLHTLLVEMQIQVACTRVGYQFGYY